MKIEKEQQIICNIFHELKKIPYVHGGVAQGSMLGPKTFKKVPTFPISKIFAIFMKEMEILFQKLKR